MIDETKFAFVDTETCGLDPERNPIWEVAVIIDGVEHHWFQRLPLVVFNPIDDRPRWYPPTAVVGELPRGIALVPWELGYRRPHLDQWVVDNTGIMERYDHDAALNETVSTGRFANLTKGRILVGAVPSFDEERMRRQFRQHIDHQAIQFPWHYQLIDVETLAAGYLTSMRHAGVNMVGEWGREVPYPDPMLWPLDSDQISKALGLTPSKDGGRHTALADARWAREVFMAVMGG